MMKEICAGCQEGRIVIFMEETRTWIEGIMRGMVKGVIMSNGRIKAEICEGTEIMAGSEILTETAE